MPLTVQVVTPEREVTVCEDATFVLAHGTEGDVGILPGLAPMLIALGIGPLKIEEGERESLMLVDGGFLQVKDDKVIVLAEYAVLPEEVSADVVSARVDELRRRIQTEQHDQEAARELARQEALHKMLRM
jgi:F-type H+-transporting ATPase subunit epsilon